MQVHILWAGSRQPSRGLFAMILSERHPEQERIDFIALECYNFKIDNS